MVLLRIHVTVFLSLLNSADIGVLGTSTCDSVQVSGANDYSGTYDWDISINGFLDSSSTYVLGYVVEITTAGWYLGPYTYDDTSGLILYYPYYYVEDTASHPADTTGYWWYFESGYEYELAPAYFSVTCADDDDEGNNDDDDNDDDNDDEDDDGGNNDDDDDDDGGDDDGGNNDDDDDGGNNDDGGDDDGGNNDDEDDDGGDDDGGKNDDDDDDDGGDDEGENNGGDYENNDNKGKDNTMMVEIIAGTVSTVVGGIIFAWLGKCYGWWCNTCYR